MNTGNDVIISAALTGAVTPKDINEHIPLTPEEIAAAKAAAKSTAVWPTLYATATE